jgi:Tfp pilus assembly major pilin PilA
MKNPRPRSIVRFVIGHILLKYFQEVYAKTAVIATRLSAVDLTVGKPCLARA